MDKKSNNKLTYGNQLDFKAWAHKKCLSKISNDCFYFDYITPVDGICDPDSACDTTIYGFSADGTTTWGKALNVLKKHFKIA